MAVSGNTAYVRSSEGLLVLDVSNPARLRKLDNSSEVERGDGVVLAGEVAYVLGGQDGLLILDRYLPPLRFETGLALDSTGLHVVLRGEPDQSIRLQRSRDLKTWEDWVNMSGTGSSQEVVDPSAGSLSSQFYRLVPPATAEPKFRAVQQA